MQKKSSVVVLRVDSLTSELVEVEKAGKQSFFLNGCLVAKNLARVHCASSGLVKTVLCTEGQVVSQGQVLLEFDSCAANIAFQLSCVEYQQALSSLAWVEKKFARSKEAFDEGLISLEQFQADQYEQTKASLAVGQAKLKQELAEVSLNNHIIKSPIAGTVCSIKAAPSDRIQENTLLFEIMPENPLWIGVFSAQEFDLKGLAVGQRVLLNVHSLDKNYWSTVTFVSKVAKQRGTFSVFEVHVAVEYVCQKNFASGLSVEIEVLSNG